MANCIYLYLHLINTWTAISHLWSISRFKATSWAACFSLKMIWLYLLILTIDWSLFVTLQHYQGQSTHYKRLISHKSTITSTVSPLTVSQWTGWFTINIGGLLTAGSPWIFPISTSSFGLDSRLIRHSPSIDDSNSPPVSYPIWMLDLWGSAPAVHHSHRSPGKHIVMPVKDSPIAGVIPPAWRFSCELTITNHN